MSYGLGFSHQEVNARCETVVQVHEEEREGVGEGKKAGQVTRNQIKELGCKVIRNLRNNSVGVEMGDTYRVMVIGGNTGMKLGRKEVLLTCKVFRCKSTSITHKFPPSHLDRFEIL